MPAHRLVHRVPSSSTAINQQSPQPAAPGFATPTNAKVARVNPRWAAHARLARNGWRGSLLTLMVAQILAFPIRSKGSISDVHKRAHTSDSPDQWKRHVHVLLWYQKYIYPVFQRPCTKHVKVVFGACAGQLLLVNACGGGSMTKRNKHGSPVS